MSIFLGHLAHGKCPTSSVGMSGVRALLSALNCHESDCMSANINTIWFIKNDLRTMDTSRTLKSKFQNFELPNLDNKST